MKNTKHILLILFGILLGVACVVFALTNKEPVVLKFLYYETMPIWSSLLVFVSMFIGACFFAFFWSVASLKKRSELKKLNRQIETLETELISYRNQPLEEPDSPAMSDMEQSDI